MEIKTDNLEIGKLALAVDIARHYLYSYEAQRQAQEKAFVEFLKRFADAYEVINDMTSAQYTHGQIKATITRIEEELQVAPPKGE
jgi:predicted Ser/Thr protein kinase